MDNESDRVPIVNPDRNPVTDDEHEAWLNLSMQGLEEAYGEDEPEYSTDLVKKINPDYVGR